MDAIALPISPLADGGNVVLLVLVVAAALAFAYHRYRRQQQRREQLRLLAEQRGWRFNRRDPFRLLGHGFSLLRRGDGRGVENVVSGEDDDGLPVRVFDYWFYDQHTDAKGNTSRRYSRFTCAILPLPDLHAPRLRIEPEHLLSRLGDALGFKDQQFESEEFNRRFQVRCDDARFASTVVDARMMDWLLGLRGDHRIELLGAHVLIATDRIDDPAGCLAMHDVAKGFRDQIPEVTASLYPSRRQDRRDDLPR